MKPEQFTAWLRGFVELNGPTTIPNQQQWQIIKDHLTSVFNKITPNRVMYKANKICHSTVPNKVEIRSGTSPYKNLVDPTKESTYCNSLSYIGHDMNAALNHEALYPTILQGSC